MTTPSRIASGLYRLDTTVTGTAMPLAIYLIEGERWLVTDSGCVGMMRELAIPAAQALRPGSTIGRAVISHAHADHFGGNAELLAADPSCSIYVHRDDFAWASEPAWHVRDAYDALGPEYPCPDAVKVFVAGLLGPPTPVSRLETGDVLELDDGRRLRVVHLPGHSPGHIGLWEPSEGLLLLSDAILGGGQLIDGKIVAIPSYLDVDAYLASIRTVRALEPTLTCPAHFPVMDAEQTWAFCDESEAFVVRLDRAIRDLLRAGDPHTLQEITASVVPMVAPGADVSVVAGLSVQAHLNALECHGVATWTMAGEQRAWTIA